MYKTLQEKKLKFGMQFFIIFFYQFNYLTILRVHQKRRIICSEVIDDRESFKYIFKSTT